MAKRIICSIVAVCLLCSVVPLAVFASDDFQEGYIKVTIINNGSTECYPARLYGETVYMSIDAIGQIAGYNVEVGDLISFVKSTQTDYVTFVDVMFEGVAEAQGKEWAIDLVSEDDEYYLPLAEMLYLLHAQWAVEDGTLVVQQLPENIADFLDRTMSSLWTNRTNPTDLLINGESELAHTLRCSLAAMFTDFDIFDHIDWDMTAPGYDYKVEVDEDGNADVSFEIEPEGESPFVGEQYEKALLQLSVDDEEFLQSEDQTKIAQILEDSDFKQIKSAWDTMNKTMEFPTKIPETAEQLSEMLDQIETASGQKPSKFFDAFGDMSGLKDVPWKNYTDFLSKYKVNEIVDFIGKCVEVNEIYQRSQNWDDAFIGQMEVLTDFDNTGYNTGVTDYIKEQSRKIVDEYADNGQATRTVAVDRIFDFVAGLGLDATPLGMIVSLPNLGIAGVSILNEDAKTAMDSAALAYMVDCLIKTEHVALVEMARSYEDMLALCVGSGFDEDDLERLRNATMLSLRCNLRNRAFIYYLNTLSNDDPNWEQTEEAKNIRTQIQEYYVAICNLMETEGYDRVLIRTDLGNLFNLDEKSVVNFSEYGDVRQEFGAEVFAKELPVNEKKLTQIDEYSEDGELQTRHEFTYDDNGLITSITIQYDDHEEIFTYSYNSEGRLIEKNGPIGYGGNKYIYNDKGQIIEADLGYGWGYYVYNNQGNVSISKETFDNGTYETKHHYNSDGLNDFDEESYTDAYSGEVESTIYYYSYDSQGRLVEKVYENEYGEYRINYDHSYRPFVIESWFVNGKCTDIYANLWMTNGVPIYTLKISSSAHILTSPGQYADVLPVEPLLLSDEDGYMAKAVGNSVRDVRVFRLYYDDKLAVALNDQSKYETVGRLEVTEYFDLNTYEFAELFDMQIKEGPGGCNGFGKGEYLYRRGRWGSFYSISLHASTELTDEPGCFQTSIISEQYSIYGIYVGMSYDECINSLRERGFTLRDEETWNVDESYFYYFFNDSGDRIQLDIYKDICNGVEIWPNIYFS